MKQVVVAGIGTGIGKTLVAAILTEALEADYWKPVQAGNLDFTDTDFVRQHISNKRSFFHPEVYSLSEPMSPHAAAMMDGIEIELSRLSVPATANRLIIEPPGGLMVPLNERQLNIDLIRQWDVPVILVSQNYLGSINHTLLSVQALRDYGITIAGIIFNGERKASTEDFILHYTKLNCLAVINQEPEISKPIVKKYAGILKEKISNYLA